MLEAAGLLEGGKAGTCSHKVVRRLLRNACLTERVSSRQQLAGVAYVVAHTQWGPPRLSCLHPTNPPVKQRFTDTYTFVVPLARYVRPPRFCDRQGCAVNKSATAL
ncbi:hypothetical protein BaRGS_00033899 [Batillaria attramentaria]|uniref:Uncharacterized protein n=1 Tax=Batillaria attramentaria TaxID=370345 RepID=A0ABD0JK34_9CAEN